MDMSISLIMVVVSIAYTDVKTFQVIYLKYVQFIVSHLHVN